MKIVIKLFSDIKESILVKIFSNKNNVNLF